VAAEFELRGSSCLTSFEFEIFKPCTYSEPSIFSLCQKLNTVIFVQKGLPTPYPLQNLLHMCLQQRAPS
jgi:hypothetical protein